MLQLNKVITERETQVQLMKVRRKNSRPLNIPYLYAAFAYGHITLNTSLVRYGKLSSVERG